MVAALPVDRARTKTAIPRKESWWSWFRVEGFRVCLGVPMTRIIVYWDPYCGPLILGNCHVDSRKNMLATGHGTILGSMRSLPGSVK